MRPRASKTRGHLHFHRYFDFCKVPGRSRHYHTNTSSGGRMESSNTSSLRSVIRQLQRLVRPSATLGLSDAELLDRFARQRDESAFAELLQRHGHGARRLPAHPGRLARGRGRLPGDVSGARPPRGFGRLAGFHRQLALRRRLPGGPQGTRPPGAAPRASARRPLRTSQHGAKIRRRGRAPRRGIEPAAREIPGAAGALLSGRAIQRRGRPPARLACRHGLVSPVARPTDAAFPAGTPWRGTWGRGAGRAGRPRRRRRRHRRAGPAHQPGGAGLRHGRRHGAWPSLRQLRPSSRGPAAR